MNETAINLPTIADGEDKSSPFKNRIRKNYRHLRKWAKRTCTDCFRFYDRDVKGYPVAIDFYAGRFCVHYFTPDSDKLEPPLHLRRDVEEAICSIFACGQEAIFWRTRMKREKQQQYEKLGVQKQFFPVVEYGVKFLVNLEDYVDTGLFLDHRETRHYVASLAKGKRVLNLFAYTCSFSVHAALAGAVMTKSVDLSNTYTDWGRNNFLLNNVPLKNHEIVRADCLRFLQEEARTKHRYNLIIVDPPTISRSKKMVGMFDVQLDHVHLLQQAMQLLAPDGTLIFSTNSRKFRLESEAFEGWNIKEITDKTIPEDFRNKKIHHCWKFSQMNN